MSSFLNNLFARGSPFPCRQGKQLYDVISTCQGYEERRYRGCTWASTTISGVYHDHAKFEGFRRLGAYVNELRSQGVEISMAPPILTRVEPNSGGSGFDSMFTVSVLLSNTMKHPTVPASVTTPNVFIERSPETTVYVSVLQGLASDEKWACEARNLANMVQNTRQMTTDFYITASYDSPLQLVSTHNEVWIIKRDSNKTSAASPPNMLMGKYSDTTKKLKASISQYTSPLIPTRLSLINFILSFFTFMLALFKRCSQVLVQLIVQAVSILRFGNAAVTSVTTLNDISAQKIIYLALYLNKKLWGSVANVCIQTALAFADEGTC